MDIEKRSKAIMNKLKAAIGRKLVAARGTLLVRLQPRSWKTWKVYLKTKQNNLIKLNSLQLQFSLRVWYCTEYYYKPIWLSFKSHLLEFFTFGCKSSCFNWSPWKIGTVSCDAPARNILGILVGANLQSNLWAGVWQMSVSLFYIHVLLFIQNSNTHLFHRYANDSPVPNKIHQRTNICSYWE